MQTSVRAGVAAAGAIALLITGGATALAAGSSPQVGAARLTVVAHPAPRAGAAVAAIPHAGPLDDTMSEPECRAQSSAYSTPGYGKTRFISCIAQTFAFTSLLCGPNFTNCTPIGGGTFNMTNIALAQNGGRTVTVTQTLDGWTSWGDIIALDLSDLVQCTASNAQSGPCFGYGGPIVQSVVQWMAVGQTTRSFSFSQPVSSGTGSDFISYAYTQATFTLTSFGAPPVTAQSAASGFRCDSAPYMVSTYAGEGCVFDWVTETLHYSLSNPNQTQSANHILTAQTNPGSTTPPVPGKFIPGAPGSQPLHRITEDAWITSNRNVANAACNQYFPGYTSQGLQCDEYPFATTLEGAANTANGYSVLPIAASDNMSAGGSLGNFYNARRILGLGDHHDPFFVQIDP